MLPAFQLAWTFFRLSENFFKKVLCCPVETHVTSAGVKVPVFSKTWAPNEFSGTILKQALQIVNERVRVRGAPVMFNGREIHACSQIAYDEGLVLVLGLSTDILDFFGSPDFPNFPLEARNTTSFTLARVTIHEMAHIFWAIRCYLQTAQGECNDDPSTVSLSPLLDDEIEIIGRVVKVSEPKCHADENLRPEQGELGHAWECFLFDGIPQGLLDIPGGPAQYYEINEIWIRTPADQGFLFAISLEALQAFLDPRIQQRMLTLNPENTSTEKTSNRYYDEVSDFWFHFHVARGTIRHGRGPGSRPAAAWYQDPLQILQSISGSVCEASRVIARPVFQLILGWRTPANISSAPLVVCC